MRARRPVRLAWVLVLAAVAGCAAPGTDAGGDEPDANEEEDPPSLGLVELVARAAIEPVGEGLVTRVRLRLSLAPKGSVPAEVIARAPGQGSDAFVEVRLQWRDFLGVGPTAVGRAHTRHLSFGDDGTAERFLPLERDFDLSLEAPDARMLARRITVDAVLRPVDVIQGSVRSGGVAVPFPRQTVAVFAAVPDVPFLDVLAGAPPRDPVQLFVSAAQDGLDERDETLVRVVDALDDVVELEREALFGALMFLTGETNFRSIPQWRAWIDANVPPRPGVGP